MFDEPIRDRLPNEDDEARRQRLIEAARIWAGDYLLIDDDAKLSDPEEVEGKPRSGTWVQAWMWIDFGQENGDV